MVFVIGKFFYVNKVPASGWLSVALKSSGAWVPLLEYTKLQITEISHNRVYFKMLDGGQKNNIASLGESNAKEYLDSNATKQVGAQVIVKYGIVDEMYSRARVQKYKQQTGALMVDGISAAVTLNTDLGAITMKVVSGPFRQKSTRFLCRPIRMSRI